MNDLWKIAGIEFEPCLARADAPDYAPDKAWVDCFAASSISAQSTIVISSLPMSRNQAQGFSYN